MKMLALTLVVFLPAVFGNAVGPKETLSVCTQSNSCNNLLKAVECGQLNHCIKHGWVQQKYNGDSDEICRSCISMVESSKDLGVQRSDKNEALKQFRRGCRGLNHEDISDQCLIMTYLFPREVQSILLSDLPSETSCTAMGMCNNAVIDKLLVKKQNKRSTNDERFCKVCDIGATIWETKLSSMSEDAFLEYALNICNESPSKESCKDVMKLDYKILFNRLKRNMKADICEKINPACASKSFEIPSDGSATCQICQDLFDLVDDQTSDAISGLLQTVCTGGEQNDDDCTKIVGDMTSIAYSLVKKPSSLALCTGLGMCNQPPPTPAPVTTEKPSYEPSYNYQPHLIIDDKTLDAVGTAAAGAATVGIIAVGLSILFPEAAPVLLPLGASWG